MTSDTQHRTPDETQAETGTATVSDHIREAFDSAKEAAYNALSDVGQDTENEAQIAEKAVHSFLENLAGKSGTEVGKAAELLKSELHKIL